VILSSKKPQVESREELILSGLTLKKILASKIAVHEWDKERCFLSFHSSFKFFPEIYATYWNYWFF